MRQPKGQLIESPQPSQPLYAGYLASPKLNVSFRKAQHEPIISYATFEKIQQRLTNGARAPMRKDISEDFVLRGHVLCRDCCNPLTAAWSTSKTGKKHPYYLCYTKGCASNRKSIRRDKIESEFDGIVKSLQPSQKAVESLNTMFKCVWKQRQEHLKQAKVRLKEDVTSMENQIDQLLVRLVETDNESIISAYEKKISNLQKQKLLAKEKLEEKSPPKRSFEDLFELSLGFLANPYKIWATGQLPLKKMVLRLSL